MTLVRLHHIEAAGFCVRGARAKAKALGLDWRRFVSSGIPVEEIRHIDDVQVQRMIEVAEREEDRAQG
jgi:hypothetical protein